MFTRMSLPSDVRLDKWLWAVRLFKTRALATAACRAGQVTVLDHQAKPAREVHLGEIVAAQIGPIVRTVKVIQLADRRVSAREAALLYEDLTPPSEFEKLRLASKAPAPHRPKGTGRPTKKERRQWLGLFKDATPFSGE
jgi:ribosome-associated heat shock protein Hsp15